MLLGKDKIVNGQIVKDAGSFITSETYKGNNISVYFNETDKRYYGQGIIANKGLITISNKATPEDVISEFKSKVDAIGDSLDDKDILTLDEKEMEEFFVKDAPPNYYGAIVAVAQSANNPLATREYVRKQIEPFMQAKGVPFVENEFNQAYSEFNKAGTSKAAFFKGRDGMELTEEGKMIDNISKQIMNKIKEAEAKKDKKKYEEAIKELENFNSSLAKSISLGTKIWKDNMSKDAGKRIENYHGFDIYEEEETKTVAIFLNGAPVMTAKDISEAHREIDKYRAERKVNFQKGIKSMDSESVKSKQELLTEMVELFKSKTYDEAIEIAHYFPVVKVEEALMKGGFSKSLSQAGSRFLRGIITKDQFRAVESKSLMVRSYSVKTDKLTKDAVIQSGVYKGIVWEVTNSMTKSGYVGKIKYKGGQQYVEGSSIPETIKEIKETINHNTKDADENYNIKERSSWGKGEFQIWYGNTKQIGTGFPSREEAEKEMKRLMHLEDSTKTKDAAQSAGLPGGISQSEYSAEKKLLQDQLQKAVASGNTFKAKEVEKELASLEQEFKTKDSISESELKRRNPAAWHSIQIAKKTLRMPDAMLGVMGGTSKERAREILKEYDIPFTEDSKDAGVGRIVRTIGWYNIIEGVGTDGGYWFARSDKEDKRFKSREEAEDYARAKTGDSKTKDAKTKDEYYIWVDFKGDKRNEITKIVGKRPDGGGTWVNTGEGDVSFSFKTKEEAQAAKQKVLAIPGVRVRIGSYDSVTKDAVLEFNNVLVSVNKSSNGKYLAIARVDGQNQKVEGSTKEEAVRGIRQIIEGKTLKGQKATF